MREKACHRPQQYHASALRKNVKPLQIVESTHHPVPKLSSKPMPALFSNGFESVLFGHEPTGTYKNGTPNKNYQPMNTSKGKMHGTFMVYVARCHPASTGSNDLRAAHQCICKATFVQRLDAQHHVRLGDLPWEPPAKVGPTWMGSDKHDWGMVDVFCGSTKQKKGLDNSRNYNGFSLPSIMDARE